MASPGDYGLFVNTTQVWDVIQQIQGANVNTPEFKELLVRMYMDINRIALALNKKESGIYNTMPREFVNGNVWFSNPAYNSTTAISPALRQEYTTVVNFGALPDGTATPTKSVPHNLPVNTAYTWTQIYATATDPVGLTGLSVGFATPIITDAISLTVDATNVNITVDATKDYSNYTICLVVLKYLKN